jgi:hypothetical protein
MDRNIVYPAAIPLDTDLLSINRNTMVALGYLAQAVFGRGAVADGLVCTPTSPPSMTLTIGSGSLALLSVVDAAAYGSLPADVDHQLIKMGINLDPTSVNLTAPGVPGQTVNYLIQATLQEQDVNPVVLPYYNAADPSIPFSGPGNNGATQNTLRTQTVLVQAKVGLPANTGSQVTPAADNGWYGLYVISVSYGQSAIDNTSISVYPLAPFINWHLPSLSPGFGAGVQSFTTSGTFVVPPGVSQVEVELWGGGSGSYASLAGAPSGGGSGGGYARKRIIGLAPGQQVNVVVGMGGGGGVVGGVGASAGGASSFGSFVSATGGSLNYLATVAAPQNGATPAGVGVGGDANFNGSAGQAGFLNQGGLGGAAPMGGAQNSGTSGVPGVFPGGGASGAGTGANGNLPFNGAPGANGFVVVRW